jgi:glycine hydroxymethyltransferase
MYAITPFSYTGKKRPEPRAKVDFEVLQRVKAGVRDLAASVGIDTDVDADDYPHTYYLPDDGDAVNWTTLSIHGDTAGEFLQTAITADVLALDAGETAPTWILKPDGSVITHGVVERTANSYRLHVARRAGYVATWFRSLSDGFVLIDPTDPYAKSPGPVDVRIDGPADVARLGIDPKREPQAAETGYANKAYFIGINGAQYPGPTWPPLPAFEWTEPTADLKTTPLHSLHKSLGAKMTEFAGYDMPVWYSSVSDEHLAVRGGAGVFDVTHMGVFDAKGPGAEPFLSRVTTNDVYGLAVGDSHYTYFLDVDGVPFDDLMIYRLADDHFLIVVNASNNDKNWAWLNAVKNQTAIIDRAHPGRVVEGGDRFALRDLRADTSGVDRRVDVALQGPKSKDILLSLDGSADDKAKVKALAWANVTRATLGGFDLIVSRTGYTGERVAYEIFVHPDHAAALFQTLVDRGVTPAGLAARDSLRTEAGLPLYGHELGGSEGLNPADAGFGSYVKLSKPFFVGKQPFIEHEMAREAEVVRFRMENKRARPAHPGDPVLDENGGKIGVVTSCSIDSERYQLGQAYVKFDGYGEGSRIQVVAGSARGATNAEPATILTRFPSKKK